MRILFICNEYPPDRAGGIGVFTQQLARALVLRGHQVFVVGISQSPRVVDDEGVRVTMISAGGTGSPHADLLARQWALSRAARSLVATEGIDLVEAPDYRGQGAFLNLPTRLPVPIIVRYHGTASVLARHKGKGSSRLIQFLERRGLLSASRRVAVSRFIADATKREFPEVAPVDEVIHNFTDARRFAPDAAVARDPNLLLFLGKISHVKGVRELFAALPLIFERVPAARLELAAADSLDGAGGTSLKEELLRGLPAAYHARVAFLGPVPHAEVPGLYRRAAVCVFPSRMEALAIAPLEAMACGCAVVVNGGSSFPEVVSHGTTGLHADAQSPGDLADKVVQLLADGTLAQRLGEAARRAVLDGFDLPVAVASNERFFERCLNCRGDSLFR